MSKYKNFFDDLIKINPSLSYELGYRDKYSCSHITDHISNDYLSKYYNLSLKYANTDDIELKFELEYIKDFYKYKIYLYFIICPYDNDIINFYYENKSKKYKKELTIDFNKYINSIIKRLKEGLRLKITIPYMICIKFMNRIILFIVKYTLVINKFY